MSPEAQSLLTLLGLIFGSVGIFVAVLFAILFDFTWLED